MLKIRMQRLGKINQPSYRIVVVEHTESPKTGNIVEKVGTYNPKTKERNLDADRIKYWLSVGAQASPTVHNMLVSLKIVDGKKINILPAYKAPAAAAEEEKAAEAEKAAEQEAKAEAKAAHDAEVRAEAEQKKEEVPAPELNDDPKAGAAAAVEAAKEPSSA